MEDTIFALATAQGKAGVAIVRISGSQSTDVLAGFGVKPPEPRRASVAYLLNASGETIDQALVLFFTDGASFTGEDVVELHLHGSVAVVRAVLSAIAEAGVARMAEPGEFTRRALLNGRMDLTQVQGLGDLIDAETEGQRKHAMRVLTGEVADRIGSWRRDLVRAIALTEATIDFADEEVPEDVSDEVRELVLRTAQAVDRELAATAGVARLKSGFEVALVGAPNAGKSSLLNALTRSDAAIVTEIPGTTRDVVEVRCDINGLPVTFLDTAGLRDTLDPIEEMGVSRAVARGSKADLRIFLHEEPTAPIWRVEKMDNDIIVRTKIDLAKGVMGISSKTGEGLADLMQKIGARLKDQVSDDGLVSRERDKVALRTASEQLALVLEQISWQEPDIQSLNLRSAIDALERIIGGVDIELVLDEIFSSFCLGK